MRVGERVEVTARGKEIVIRPIIEIPRHQGWFWNREWQAQVAQSIKEIKKGKITIFKSVKEARKYFDD